MPMRDTSSRHSTYLTTYSARFYQSNRIRTAGDATTSGNKAAIAVDNFTMAQYYLSARIN
jgi:hypothetical protein